ncbi:MAG TPA: UrcA family protein [Erythrobacter sp.]|jgi:UrcA family protein|nr:UrcA family protein [Qipengyuania citrea]HBM71152.1 UrcA family protein [Erythrobacter sp.]HCJ20616.1 UrcA family protein [Erythrobacter sp.]|tara:strand:+ start:317 stop:667 length:351 start_codon:yes stop_codon:yes gene_type:complete
MFEERQYLQQETLVKIINLLAAGLAATALLGAPAQALSKRTEVSIAVDFNDLDLRDPSQLAELRDRVDAAAQAACTHPEALSVNAFSYDRRCKASLVASAQQMIRQKATATLASAR